MATLWPLGPYKGPLWPYPTPEKGAKFLLKKGALLLKKGANLLLKKGASGGIWLLFWE